MNIKKYIATIIIATGMSFQAQAALITFEGQFNTIYTAPITRLGFNIGNVTGDLQHFHEVTSTQFGLPNNGTGVLQNDRNTRIFVEEQSTLDFFLASVDVAAALNNLPAVGITIEGFLNGVSTGTITLGTLGTSYTTLFGASLGTIDRLVFDGIGGQGGFILDNLTLNESTAVPEPATLALLGLGLACIGFGRRKIA